MKHIFDINIAKLYGIEEAILLENIYFWVEKNRANEQNFHDGYYWTYNSVRAFNELFKYMTPKKIVIAIKKLEENELVKSGNYNKLPFDRTKWYTLTEKAYILLKAPSEAIYPKSQMQLHIGQMDLSQKKNGISQNDKPIPDVNTNINTNINTYISSEKISKKSASKKCKKTEDEKHAHKERDRELKRIFTEEIWERYPKSHRVGEKTCFSKFKSAINNGSSQEEILDGFNRYLKVIEINQRKGTEQFIKRLDNWFAAESWKNPNLLMVSKADSKLQHQMNSKYPSQNYCGLPPVFLQEKEDKRITIDVTEEEYNQWMGL